MQQKKRGKKEKKKVHYTLHKYIHVSEKVIIIVGIRIKEEYHYRDSELDSPKTLSPMNDTQRLT